MDLVMKKDSHHIFKKKTGRYAVRNPKKKFLTGEEKTKFLLAAGIIKKDAPKPKAAAKAPEAVETETQA